MSLQPIKEHGVFSWNELVTTDVAAAKAFYREALGWELEDLHNPGMDYTIARKGDREVAGIMTLPGDAQDMPPAWGSYVTVDNVDTRIARIQKLGGKVIVAPRDIPRVGRFAVIADPQGAMLALITYFDKD